MIQIKFINVIKNKSLYTIVGFFILFSNIMGFGQNPNLSLISNGGESFRNDKYQLDWSIGENVIETFSNENYIVTQGLHQARYNITSILDNNYDQIDMRCYPNPTINKINVSISKNTSFNISDLKLNISNLNGYFLEKINITSNITEIDLSKYSSGIYFINVSKGEKLIKSYTIIKTYK